MLLAKIKGNKVYFWKFVTFLGEGGQFTPTYPLDPLEGVSNLLKKFSGGVAKILCLRGG